MLSQWRHRRKRSTSNRPPAREIETDDGPVLWFLFVCLLIFMSVTAYVWYKERCIVYAPNPKAGTDCWMTSTGATICQPDEICVRHAYEEKE